jgi:ABC-2 type transport system permease protein
MTYRVGVHAASAWQIGTSALVMTLAIWALIRIAGRIYSGALLRYGSRVPLRDVVRSSQ